MAKQQKKRGKTPQRKRKIGLSWWIGIGIVTLLSIYEYFRPQLLSEIDQWITYLEELAGETTPTMEWDKGVEIPAPLEGVSERIITHNYYTTSYNSHYKIPNWVAYELTAEECRGSVERSNNFTADPTIGTSNSLNSSYSKSGYDRGHLAPAADMAFNTTAMKQSFYFTNIAPQHPTLNRGVWKELEELVRSWALQDSALYVVSGNIVKGRVKYIGKSKVAVPTYIYKAVLSPHAYPPRAIAFLFKNEKQGGDPAHYAISIDSLEQVAEIDLFPTLPDKYETKWEAAIDINHWNWQ